MEERWQSAPRRKNSVTHFGRKRASRIWVSYTSQSRIIKARHAQQLDILCKIIKAKPRTYAEAPLIIFNTQKARSWQNATGRPPQDHAAEWTASGSTKPGKETAVDIKQTEPSYALG